MLCAASSAPFEGTCTFFIIFFSRKGGGKTGFAGFAAHARSKSASHCGPEAQHPGAELQALPLPSPDLPREPNEALLVNRAASCPPGSVPVPAADVPELETRRPKKTHARALEQENNLGAVPALTPAAPDCKQLGGLEAAPAAAASPAPAPRLAFCVFGLRAERRNGIRPSKDGVYWKQMWLQGPKGILGGGFCASGSQPCRSPPSLHINACRGPKFGAKTSRSSSNPPRAG